MKILKYLFLLALLSLVALTVFVATQKGIFDVERSKVINSPKATVYNYINDFRNYEDFESWALEDPSLNFTFPNKTAGNGASFYWTGTEGSGNAITLKTKDGESIQQKMKYDGTEADVNWTFKDTLAGKTKVTWKAKGTMSFLFKIYTALNGGSNKVIGTIYEKSLANIDKNLDYETKTYNIKVDGVVQKTETPYIKQTFTSEISKINKNARIVIPKLIHFSETNALQTTGKPFIIYHTYDTTTGLAKISICLPINKEISTSSGSDILSGKLNGFEAVKTTLTGDYSHTSEAIAKTTAYINNQKIMPDLSWSHLEILTVSKLDTKSSSKLLTEIYFPTKPKVVPVTTAPTTEVYGSQPDPTETNTTTADPAATNPAATTPVVKKPVKPKPAAPKPVTTPPAKPEEDEF
ncbi:Polyketide cyclase / dehydrase and lipid transport [Flavobacterium resistens]|uniref:Polyketide cyclase / dehydrase and lipid transport n=1 Tax=Flavobacterium resistens TaxID=443612 RepID=A0A521DJD1_9FLAO|nr:transcriptional regulator [Flavobacterium resistens]MRX68770.1 transcriptional regulator [Flavobacterium resistens]SMO71776.1 Polyketide cyclase / dehydrase and lipid transport [Flavobacterium resistens]